MSEVGATGVPPITSRSEYKESDPKTGTYRYWTDELQGSMSNLAEWHKQAERIHRRFLDERKDSVQASDRPRAKGMRLNLFHANIKIQSSQLYGDVPKIDVLRTYSDANDDIARVASEMLERILNNDARQNREEYDSVLRATLQDRLVPGLGVAKVRYDAIERGNDLIESAPADYFHWRDVLWSWSRTFVDLRWMAYRTYHTKRGIRAKFNLTKAQADTLTYKQQAPSNTSAHVADDRDRVDAWMKAEVWEIWDKRTRQVHHISVGYDKILKTISDPLQLRNFFPSPPFFIANPTTTQYLPTPDWHFSQDLYTAIDTLSTRMAVITEAVKVAGVYDAANPEIARMLNQSTDNKLIPVENWAMFGEKGGLKGAIDWFPIADIVAALQTLRQERDANIQLLYQVNGIADIMRGQLDNQYEGVGQSEMKTKFGSIRMRDLQQEFATFATCLVQLKAEIIGKHFDPESILRQANMEFSMDAQDMQLIQQAVQLIKDPRSTQIRVKIKAESLAMKDWEQLQAERTEFVAAIGGFFQAVSPILQADPSGTPFMMKLLQWGLAGYRGADEVEGVIDQAIKASEAAQKQQQQNPKPDPERQKQEAQMQLEQAKAQSQLQIIQAKAQAELQTRQSDLQADMQTAQYAHQISMAESQADLQREMATITAKAEADIMTEQATSEINAEQQAKQTEGEIVKDAINHRQELERIELEATNKIAESVVAAAVKPEPKGG